MGAKYTVIQPYHIDKKWREKGYFTHFFGGKIHTIYATKIGKLHTFWGQNTHFEKMENG